MKRFLRLLLSDNNGQDLIEYSLLIAFVALSSAALFLGTGSNTSQVWSSANSVLTVAAGGSGAGGTHHGGDGGRD